MIKVLITGANSFVGTNVEKWLMREPDKFYVETLDIKDPSWRFFDFSTFDVVFHVAGIAHVSTKKSMRNLYFEVNRDLSIETATKAKKAGVKQFIFMSSMIVYNSKETRITHDTKPNPDNFYGMSKLQAEEGIISMQSKDFNVCILRPPMIYGHDSRGNFLRLINFAGKMPVFPLYRNIRSALFIDNLSMYIRLYILQSQRGICFPQNEEYFATSDLVEEIRKILGKTTHFTRVFNPFILISQRFIRTVNKLFSNYYYYPIDRVDFVRIKFVDSLEMTIKGTVNHE